MNILIAGAYGVGKTFITDRLKNILSVPAYTASQLIKHSKNTKQVKDIRLNQELLIDAVSQINLKLQSIIIDGHFCLLNERNEIETIGADVFEALNIKKIILLHDDVSEIEKRLQSRNGSAFSKSLIEEIQNAEIDHADYVSTKLAIPMFKYNVKNQELEEVIKFIKN